MPLDWRETHTGEDKPKGVRYRVRRFEGKIVAEDQANATLLEGDFKTYDDAKKACDKAYEDAQKAQPSEPAPAAPVDARQAPPRPATPPEPPKPAHGHQAHQPAHKGRR